MGLVFGVRIFCYGKVGWALTFESERSIAERVCWKWSKHHDTGGSFMCQQVWVGDLPGVYWSFRDHFYIEITPQLQYQSGLWMSNGAREGLLEGWLKRTFPCCKKMSLITIWWPSRGLLIIWRPLSYCNNPPISIVKWSPNNEQTKGRSSNRSHFFLVYHKDENMENLASEKPNVHTLLMSAKRFPLLLSFI